MLSICCIACSPYKYYVKKDFQFYSEGFFQKGLLPKTQGVYVLEQVFSKGDGHIADHKFKGYTHFYKFFKTGQQNSYLVAEKDFDGNYLGLVRHEAATWQGRTLFQGYYKLKEDHIILEGVNAALGKFYYTHGRISDDRLEIISTVNADVKNFDESKLNYLVIYTYVFKPFDEQGYQEVEVDW
jgi:hypothetical protein